jgi:hypothetical protein
MDPLLYAIIVISVAGALLGIGGWLASRRHR